VSARSARGPAPRARGGGTTALGVARGAAGGAPPGAHVDVRSAPGHTSFEVLLPLAGGAPVPAAQPHSQTGHRVSTQR
ncbi:two-component sensor histidine kinase, partial [Streptomyces sp. NPDC056401]